MRGYPQQYKDEILQEVEIQKDLDHPNILKVIEYYITSNENLCIIIEYAEKGDLDKKVKDQNGKPFTVQ